MMRFFSRLKGFKDHLPRRFGAGILGASTMFSLYRMSGYLAGPASNDSKSKSPKSAPPEENLITIAEMKKMCQEGRIVVSFKGGVFDVTEFTGHPGGVGRLQMVAGEDLEPFWKVYTQHNRGHIVECVLSWYRHIILMLWWCL
jgi:hypothetical protein